MMVRRIFITLLFAALTVSVQAQFSPGPLTNAHADLEGVQNCTQCHTIGNKVEDKKCLECHDEIKVRMDAKRGFHNSREVRTKDCVACHSEHHGKKFDMLRFDQDNFDHDLTGYELTGEHNRIECRDCHTPDFIEDQDLKNRKNTFLGLEQDCVACHEDVHQNTLSTNDCASCHSTETFTPAEYFDHDDTEYPLIGKHIDVECIECHQMEIRNGKEFQEFTGLEFDNCISCHEDEHNNNLGTNCKQCHHESSWTSLRRVKRFNHDRTKFPLKGSHKKVDCKECHNMDAPPATIFQDQIGVGVNDCISCHEDVHENKFGTNCAECHNEDSFFSVETDDFDHSKTDFDLVGKHVKVDCRECHTESLTAPLAHNECAACHSDYHEGEFAVDGVSPDCAECHTEEGFEGSLYTIEQHNQTKFPLEGGHLATPCFACHLPDDSEKWKFRNIGEDCVDCHEDVHEGYIAAEYYPEQDCEKCHVVDTWVDISFDHNLTGFELLGKHAEATCMDCHQADENAANRYERFADSPQECAECHDNVHEDQFVVDGVTDCARCHGFDDWVMDDFDHDNTAFPLEGAHQAVACEDCHKPTETESGKIITQYKFNSFECIDCHQ